MGIRSQWTGISGSPKAGYMAVDGVLEQMYKRHGAGINLTYDKIGGQAANFIFLQVMLCAYSWMMVIHKD